MIDIFVSYASEDVNRVRPIGAALEGEGWSVFWDRYIPAGKTWREVIGEALAEAKCVLVVWSKDAIVSSWVHEEAEEGRVRGILVPVRIDDVDAPLGFRSYQVADLVGWKGDPAATAFRNLVRDVDRLCPGRTADGGIDEPGTTTVSSAGPADARRPAARSPAPKEERRRPKLVLYATIAIALVGLFGAVRYGLITPSATTALRTARIAEYNDWLRGYLTSGGQIGRVDTSTFDKDDFYVATQIFTLRDDDLSEKKNIIIPQGINVDYDDLRWSELYFMDGFSTTESAVVIYEAALEEFRDIAGPRIDELAKEQEEKDRRRAAERAAKDGRQQRFTLATVSSGISDYASWLRGYIASGGKVTKVTSRDFPMREFFLITKDTLFAPDIFNIDSNYIVSHGVKLDLSQRSVVDQRAQIFFMDDYRCICEDVTIYDNMKSEFGFE